MTGSITPDEIDAARRLIADVLVSTSNDSMLSQDEQDRLLARACADACGVLGAWLEGTSWAALSPDEELGRRMVAESVADWERLRPFLPSVLKAVDRVEDRKKNGPSTPEIIDPAAYVDKLIASASLTARRQRR
ncbi:MAG TPA: hypothetical protein VGD91_13585, partial [Trebonia sp.]